MMMRCIVQHGNASVNKDISLPIDYFPKTSIAAIPLRYFVKFLQRQFDGIPTNGHVRRMIHNGDVKLLV